MHVLDAPRTESSRHSKHDPAHITAPMAMNFGYVVGCIKLNLLVKFCDVLLAGSMETWTGIWGVVAEQTDGKS